MSNTIHTPSPSESSSPYATAASAKDNASRLRENQRRSRARKKEYLTSLEARFQACQRAGIEANVEIQNAAKKVVRENFLLREMLRNRDVGDDEIDRVIREGGEGSVNGESAVGGVLKVLGRRPCGGEPLPAVKLGDERFNERRNSTGMLAARDAGDRVTRSSETSCPPATGSGTCASAKCSSQLPLSPPSPVLQLSTHHRPPPPPPAFTPQHYPSPSGTPTSAVPTYALPVSAPQLNPYYAFSSPPPPPSQSYTVTSPTYPPANAAAAGYQQFYPAPPQNASPQSSSNCCFPPPQQQQQQQQQQYQNSCSTSMTPCHLAQTFIHQLHPQDSGQLVNEICPPEAMSSGNCHVENSALFNLLDKI
ncbi:hypothetical protein C7212DRAFT_344174 [Tuber magnatum]|uniref:BZIP domain-containing protein n=1 Tax=Tuber magnatum TaxID=42249 RepID=A0A317SQ21_9PEZI|nr:hypothetical protein C7212DRAFT_344174 [Tuber magnatum]